jgi:ethanolamine permease
MNGAPGHHDVEGYCPPHPPSRFLRCGRPGRRPGPMNVQALLLAIAAIFAIYIPLAQIITFSILSGLLNYTFMPFNIWKFRKKWPLGSIQRGYEHPFHPLPAAVLLLLCIATFVAVYLGYGRQLLAMVAFYIIASLWFAFYRYRYVRRGDQCTMPWPRPRGY